MSPVNNPPLWLTRHIKETLKDDMAGIMSQYADAAHEAGLKFGSRGRRLRKRGVNILASYCEAMRAKAFQLERRYRAKSQEYKSN